MSEESKAPSDEEPARGRAWRALPALGQRVVAGGRSLLHLDAAPLDMRILGRVLLHAALVGTIAGLLGAAFFAALELSQRYLVGRLAGYEAVRAVGETFLPPLAGATFRPWLLALLPAAGGLVSGLLTWRFAREAAGGGGDAAIESYHQGGVVRRRVLPVKALAAVATLGAGGSGGREGPTMQIGSAIGALVGRLLPTSARERRILLVAGIAAGMAAVFRTPLGAALLATEMLYRDDFEGEALVPAVLASVAAYSISSSILGPSALFGRLPPAPFVPAHLPLYALMALVVALAGAGFVAALRAVRRVSTRLPIPPWARPAAGGLAMGGLGVGLVLALRAWPGVAMPELGVFGGGYGLAQVAIGGGVRLPQGWTLVALLALLAAAKLAASALTIGSGGAAGDFAPSLVIGGLVGSAFGHAAALLLGDPRLQPGAFALVAMGTFYGGVAHTPLSAVIMVAELAGSYDLLVPMMLSVGISFVVLRRWSLYERQPPTKADAPLHRDEGAAAGALARARIAGIFVPQEIEPVAEHLPMVALRDLAAAARAQRACAVLDAHGVPRRMVDLSVVLVADAAVRLVHVEPDASLARAAELLAESGMSQLPVMADGRILGWVGEAEVARAVLKAAGAGTG